jgi:hypothetical protein
MSKNEIAVSDFQVPAVADMGKLFQEEMQGLSFEFDRVKIPTGGGLAFEVPGDDEDNPDMEKEIVGVIVDHHPVNAFWQDKYSGQNNPPTCSSMDGSKGIDIETGEVKPCNSCPYNQWGTAEDGRGKACKNMHRVYIKRSDELFPILLTLPPTSLKNFSNFLAKRVLGKGRKSAEVLTRVTLKKATSSQGIAYSQAAFSVAGILPAELAEEMKKYAEQIKTLTRGVAITQDDVLPAEDEDGVPF